jgi:4-hydroxythreonine-4-phosphate dehydrogenase
VVTPGDPRGVGPEVTLRALERIEGTHPSLPITILGPEGALEPTELAALAREAREETGRGSSGCRAADDVSAEAGAFAAESIEAAVRLALTGEVGAIVTAPLHKPSLHASGRPFPGQTEMLAELAGVDEVGMLMCAERTRLDSPLRVLLATTHIALADVPAAITTALLVGQLRLLDRALRSDWALPHPRIGLCALNPHASDGGLFGDEEARVFEPAVKEARALGIEVTGPLPADTVFGRALGGDFDAVVAPYHDVGMAAFKTVSFGSGVNVTLGLPFIRTSPDHGTAFDIAGRGTADESSMLEALRLAATLAENRFDTPSADV